MFLTKKHLSRRTFLKGAGVSVGLPLLDAMIPAATALAQTTAARKLRVGFFYLPHGAVMGNTGLGPAGDRWTPSGAGATFTLNAITQPLQPYKNYVTSFGNIKNDAVPAAASGINSGYPIHATQPATWLSGIAPNLTAPGPSMGPTLDQIIAGRIGQNTPLPSLQVASETTAQQASGNGAPYSVLSFRDATTPLAMEYNPRKIFVQLFNGTKDLAERKEVEKEEASLLDLINEQTRALQRDLGPADRAILDSHLTAVREAERRLDASSQSTQGIERSLGTLPPAPAGVFDRFDEQVKAIFDLIALAYRMDLTRVVSFMMAAEGTNKTYDHIGVRESFHPISHHANDPARMSQLVKIQAWHMERFAEFLGKLAAMQDGEGTVLDNAMLLYGSNMSNSDSHNNHPLPTLLVGGARGKLSGGRHIALREATPIANLQLSMLGLAGIEEKRFGDSTGALAL